MYSRKEGRTTGIKSSCAACGDQCEEKSITLALPNSSNGMAVLRNVPAEVCERCGETQFSLHTARRVMEAMRGETPPDEMVLIPIYDLNRR